MAFSLSNISEVQPCTDGTNGNMFICAVNFNQSEPSNSIYSYTWTGPNGFSLSGFQGWSSQNYVAQGANSYGTYTLVVQNTSTLESHTIVIESIQVPNLNFVYTIYGPSCVTPYVQIYQVTGVTNSAFIGTLRDSSNTIVYQKTFTSDHTLSVVPVWQAKPAPGNYKLQVCTLSNTGSICTTGCSKEVDISIVDPRPINSTLTKSDTCGSTVWISANPSGGTSPYTYSWSGPSAFTSTQKVITGLSTNGTYSCVITGANGCDTTVSTSISNAGCSALTATYSKVDATCYCNGSINLTPTGGTSPYTYLWNTGGTTQDLENLCPGNYSVTITDSASQTYSTQQITIDSSPVQAVYDVTNVLTDRDGDITLGSITLDSISGGTGPYSYLWTTGDTTSSLSNLEAGDYAVLITDNTLSCSQSLFFTIIEECNELRMSDYKVQLFNMQCCTARETQKYLSYLEQGREDLADCLGYNLMLQSVILKQLNSILNPVQTICLDCNKVQKLIDLFNCSCKCEDCPENNISLIYNPSTASLVPNNPSNQ